MGVQGTVIELFGMAQTCFYYGFIPGVVYLGKRYLCQPRLRPPPSGLDSHWPTIESTE